MTLGEKIRFCRKKAGIIQKDLAKRVGCTVKTIQAYENDKQSIKYETLEKIAWELDTDLQFFSSSKEVSKIDKIAIYNRRGHNDFPRSVVGILEVMSKRLFENKQKILCLDLGVNNFNQIDKLIGEWDNIKKIDIYGVEIDIFIKGNIEVVSFHDIEKLYIKESDKKFIENILLRTLIKKEKNYGMIVGMNEELENFRGNPIDYDIFYTRLLGKYLELCDKIIIPISDANTTRRLNNSLEKISKFQDDEAEIFILRNVDESTLDKDKMKHKESKEREMDNDIKSVIKNNKNLHIKCLNTIIPIWENTLEVISYFECNSREYLKKAFLAACSEMNLI